MVKMIRVKLGKKFKIAILVVVFFIPMYLSGQPTQALIVPNQVGPERICECFECVCPPPPTYTVTFTESGLSSSTSWNVTFGGITKSSTTTTISFIDPPNTYSYAVGTVSGYTNSLYSGTITLSGNMGKSVSFRQIIVTSPAVYAGYGGDNNVDNDVTYAAGNWNVTNVICPASGTYNSSMYVGIEDISDGHIGQVGTEEDCYYGTAYYWAWIEDYPSNTLYLNYHPQPGNEMFGEVNLNINQNKFYLTLKDLTLSKSNTISFSKNKDFYRAEWHIEKNNIEKLSDFQTFTFFNCSATVTNTYYSDFSGFNYVYSYNFAESNNSPLANLGNVLYGNQFSVQWLRSI